MALRKYFKRKGDELQSSESLESEASSLSEESQRKKQHIDVTASQKKKLYKAKLSYKKDWETKYPWVYCNDAREGMFCGTCKRWGKPPAGSRGAWTTRGIMDWNHATELLKQHADSQWHRDAAAAAAMAEQAERGKSVLELQCSSAAREAAEKRQKNRHVLLKLLRSVYFLVKNRIPHSTTYRQLVELQVANGDQLLEQHINQHPLNAQYTSRFSATMLIEAIDTWLERKLLQSLKSSPCFTILADECQDITSQEELSICFRWLVNGCPEEHYLTTLHVKSTDANAITGAIISYMSEKNLEYRKLVGQGYDGAAAFSGHRSGVQKRMRVHAGHALYIHCSCHRLQLASIQAAESVTPIKKMFGTMESLWKMFYYSPKKAEALKDVQCVLNLPELKVDKPSDTRWLSHERCLRAIRKELSSLIITLDNFYEGSGDAEAYGLSLVLSSFSGIATIFLLSAVLDLLARLNCFMQKKSADFSRLPIILEGVISEVKELKKDGAEWCNQVETNISKLTNEQGIQIRSSSTRTGCANVTTMSEYRESVATPYIDSVVSNITSRFSDTSVKLLVSSSIFDPALLPSDEASLSDYGTEQLQALVDFYGNEVTTEFDGKKYTSSPLIDGDEVFAEWRLFKRALAREVKALVEKKKLTNLPTLQEVKREMESTNTYTDIFPEIFKLLNILLTLAVGTATVERSFSQMKLVKTRLRNRVSDINLARLMRIAIEGPELTEIDFNEILEVFKEKNRRILL
jgi:hypothetical protein